MGYVIFGYVIPDRLKVVYQTAPFHVTANVQGVAASANGSTTKVLGPVK